ncbi:MAG: MobA/MobL family protein [Lachnospiraceae bacterium]|nr:MobA/MobL family protein [Lachnospiraceae bacterium]
MALYHFSLGHIKRTAGHTAIAAAAYRSGEKLYDAYYGETQDYSRKKDVVTTKIYAPDYVPERLHDRQTLWTEVEFNESRKDAQLAYSFDIALQNELTMEENIELLDIFVREEMVSRGMIVDVAIHDPDKGKHGIPNPHGHLSSPIRPFLENGVWGDKQHQEYVLDENGERIRKANGKYKTMAVSNTGWNDPALLEHWRKRWAELANAKFEEKGLSCRIDHRSNEERGITDAPQVHEGSAVRRMEAKGIKTDKGTWNHWVSKTNDAIHHILSAIREISGWMKKMHDEIKSIENPTVSDMVMRYHTHRNEVANTYSHGVQNARKTNMKQINKACNYLMENNITTPEKLEVLLAKKEKSLAGKDKDIEDLKQKAADYRDLIMALDNYGKYKPIFDQSQKIHFKGKREQFQKEHRKELNQYHKAKRRLVRTARSAPVPCPPRIEWHPCHFLKRLFDYT